jgi:pimeloyl-ACP methyl ester carboxylesterase
LTTRHFAPLSLILLSACIQPLRLARDDSPTVLSQQLLTAPNPADRGAYAVGLMFYGSGRDKQRAVYRDSVTLRTRSVNGAKLVTAPTPALGKSRKKYWGFGFDSMPVNGRVWYPKGDGPFPLVLIVHGNHDMKESSDPGYAYLGELFASRGFITVSVDENFLNGNIRGENDARGWMLLQHLRAWRGFNDSTASPFYHKVDLTRITLMGHSRGGEAVAVAAAFNTLAYYPDDATLKFDFHFGIRSIVAIAPVDGQYQPASRPTPLENVSYLVIHGSHDGDVSSFSGLRQYERVTFSAGHGGFKAAIWMYRANHGQWNTVWGSTDDGPQSARNLDLRGLIAPEEQRQMARVFLSAYLEATLHDRAEFLPIFRDHRIIGGWLPKTMYITRFEDAGFHALADYQEDVDVTTGSAPGVTISADSLATWKEGVEPLRSKGGNIGHNAVWLGWNNRIAGKDTTKSGRAASYTIALNDSLRSAWRVGPGTALEFSLAPTAAKPPPRAVAKDSTQKKDSTRKAMGDSTKGKAAPKEAKPKENNKPTAADSVPMLLSIEVTDADGARATLPLARYGVARRPLEVTVYKVKGEDQSSFGSLAELIPQSYVIPLADFRTANPRFNPAALLSVRWLFDGTPAGTVMLTDVGLSNIAPAFLAPGRP